MAITFTDEASDIFTTTLRHIRPTMADTFYTGRAFFLRLYDQRRIMIDGGREIQQNIMIDSPPGGSYGRGDELDISKKQLFTALRLPWSTYYSAITEDGQDGIENNGASAIMNLAKLRLEAARQKIEDDVATDLFLDGTNNGGKVLVGLRAAVDNGDTVATYGGITRASTGIGSRIRGNVNTVGGSFSLDVATARTMDAVVGTKKPDLILTTRTLWSRFHDRLQVSERFPKTDRGQRLANAGFEALSWMGADVVYDDKCPAGQMFFLNTSTFTFYVHQQRHFVLDGPHTPANVDQRTTRLFLACQLLCDNPRLNTIATGLT